MKSSTLLILLISSISLGCGQVRLTSNIDHSNLKEAWDVNNDPRRLHGQYEVQLAKLPTAAELTKKPWTDSYWPSYQAGLAHRWNDSSEVSSFEYPLHDKVAIAAMSIEDRKKLSPAEKYDIVQGRYDYPLVRSERGRTSPQDPSWHGLCHGWAPAAFNFEEPNPVTITGLDGTEVPFGSSDVKALLIISQQTSHQAAIVGMRCNHDLGRTPDRANDPECRDMNAGSFHIIISNFIGLLDTSFVADMTRDEQVWNQPLFGFESYVDSQPAEIPPTAAPGTVAVVRVSTTVKYISELGASWEARPFDDYPFQQDAQTVEYNLELNHAGEIIGGEWISENRPDFLWTQQRTPFKGYFEGISAIYEASRP